MRWYRKLYLGENAKKTKYKVLGRVVKNRFQWNTYLITLSKGSDLLEMYSANMLKQPYFTKNLGINHKDIFVVGIAEGREEAFLVIQNIIEDVYRQTGGFDVKAFIRNNSKRAVGG